MTNPQIENKQNDSASMNAIYSYTEWYLKNRLDALQKLDTRILAILAFAGASIKIVADLPKPSKSLLISNYYPTIECIYLAIKMLCFIFIITAIIKLIIATKFKIQAFSVRPSNIENNRKWIDGSEQEWKKFVLKQWIKTDIEIDNISQKKGKIFNDTILLLGLTILLYTIEVAILSFYRIT